MTSGNKVLGMAGATALWVLVLLMAGAESDHVQTSASSGSETSARGPETPDYMSAQLRAQVNRLKVDVSREPTTRVTMAERAEVLWQWANAYALTGGVIPNDLPLVVRSARTAEHQGEDTLGAVRRTR